MPTAQSKHDYSLQIVPVPSKKAQIQQRLLMKEGVIPNHASICIFSGPAGGGKTTLVANLLMYPQFYGMSYEGVKVPKAEDIKKGRVSKKILPRKYFDIIILLIGSADDMYDDLLEDGTIDKRIMNPTIEDIQSIIDTQEELLDDNNRNILKVPKLLIICDDLMSNSRLVKSEPFKALSIKNRHLNSSVWFLTQYINLTPKSIREQASHIFIFQCTAQCVQVLMEQFRENKTSKKEFEDMIDHATEIQDDGKRNFLYINKRSKHKFRKNLDKHLFFSWQKVPETVDLDKSDVKQHYKQAAKEDVEEKKPDPDTKFEFKPDDIPRNPTKRDDPKDQKTYLIRGRRVTFVI
jgi:hypothetical protein